MALYLTVPMSDAGLQPTASVNHTKTNGAVLLPVGNPPGKRWSSLLNF